jgi:hypothetical protein
MGRRALIVALAVMATGCGSAARAGEPVSPPRPDPAPAVHRVVHDTVTVTFARGRQTVQAMVPQAQGVMWLLRLRVPRGVAVTAVLRYHHLGGATIDASGAGAATDCTTRHNEVVCTERIEWCPFPAGRWHVWLQKHGGPAGKVTLRFVVGKPPKRLL